MPRLDVRNMTVRYGGVVANTDISVAVEDGEIVGLIGPNGAGKTTFVDAVTGFVSCSGEVRVDGRDVSNLAPEHRARCGLARTWQSVDLFPDLSVGQNLSIGATRYSWRSTLLDLVRPARASAHNQRQIDAALSAVGLSSMVERRPDELSMGHQKLVGIARALAGDPVVLLLDEPAAGLNADETERLGNRLRSLAQSDLGMLLIDHDMDLIMGVCDRVYVLDFGAVIACGTPEEVRRDPVVISAYLGEDAHLPSERSHR